MKSLMIVSLSALFLVGFSSAVLAEKCLKCHKQMEKKDFIFSFDELVSTK